MIGLGAFCKMNERTYKPENTRKMAVNTQKSNDSKTLEICQDTKGLGKKDKYPKQRMIDKERPRATGSITEECSFLLELTLFKR